MTSENKYVHGYSEREVIRLSDQASTLSDLLHSDTLYPPDAVVLEVGCGVGAQTITLTKNSPETRFVCMDISGQSLQAAKAAVNTSGRGNAHFLRADIFDLPFPDNTFDHIFVCFLLEHLRHPVTALRRLKKGLKQGGSITVIEGDHGSTYFHPDSEKARLTINCLIALQAEIGGDSLIGRRLFPLLSQAGFNNPSVSPRMVYVDAGKPRYVEGFTKNTFIAMVEGVRDKAIGSGIIDQATWDQGINDLYRTTEADGTFCYTFFKAVAFKEGTR